MLVFGIITGHDSLEKASELLVWNSTQRVRGAGAEHAIRSMITWHDHVTERIEVRPRTPQTSFDKNVPE